MMLMSTVPGSIARRTSSGSPTPQESTGTTISRNPSRRWEIAAAGEHGWVLDGRGDDVVALAQSRERDPRYREVVRLAPARREDDPSGSPQSSAATSDRACATAAAAVAPCACALEGFPKWRSRYGRIASSTSAAIGVVALWSR
jgi:hypothetical protein